MSNKDLKNFEKNIGYSFKDIEHLKIALTHKSFIDEEPTSPTNQRYEFIGDTILDYDLSLFLFDNYPNLDEGSLTKIRSGAVDQNSLVNLAKEIDIGKFLFMSKPEESTGGRDKSSILEDAVEALIAAIYFDGGLEEVNKFISKFIYPLIDKLSKNPGQKDYKTRLQEYYAKKGQKVTYTAKSEGPDHNKQFNAQVILENKIIGKGIGKSKKNAEQMAAKDAFSKMS
ncbi:MAG: ribonuclease III [Candidatus Actinomarina sp.]|jgi:ribonuclease-3|nr:ribonuclease III [Acidimicrobiaceae bacterium]|tara:strand:- start:1342 stop:2022 length:681 start_codon:yes stop_codon:yes gene_type:complete